MISSSLRPAIPSISDLQHLQRSKSRGSRTGASRWTSRGVILTDNFNPLEQLQTRKAEHYRHMLVDWFGRDLLVR